MGKFSERQKRVLSDIGLLFVAFVWGGGFVAVKDSLRTVTPMVLMAVRFTLAAGVLYLFLHKWIGRINRADLKKGAVVGFFLYMGFAAQTLGLQYTTASKQGFLTATYVVMVPFLYGVIYKKTPERRAIWGSVLTLIGIGMVSIQPGMAFNKGDGLTLVCAFFFAAHILSIEHFAREMPVFKLAFLQIAVAAVLFIASALIFEPFPAAAFPARTWVSVIYLAVFSTVACFTIQTVAQKYTASSHVSILLSLESVFAALLGVWLLSETLTPLMLAGCGLIFIAILLIEMDVFSKKDAVKHK